MSFFGRLFLLFVAVPLLELFILVQVGRLVGVWPTIGLVVFTGFAGAALARLEGLRTIWRIRSELARGRLPSAAVFDGFAILLGGALLLTPGILTDLVGFSFLLPPTRKLLLNRIRKRLEKQLKSGAIRITHIGGFPLGGRRPPDWAPADVVPDGWEGAEPRSPGEIVIEPEESRDF